MLRREAFEIVIVVMCSGSGKSSVWGRDSRVVSSQQRLGRHAGCTITRYVQAIDWRCRAKPEDYSDALRSQDDARRDPGARVAQV